VVISLFFFHFQPSPTAQVHSLLVQAVVVFHYMNDAMDSQTARMDLMKLPAVSFKNSFVVNLNISLVL